VVHADLPADRAALLHRSGRTGRAGRKGVSVLLVPYSRRRRAEAVLQAAGVAASWGGPPAAEAIRQRDQERMLADPILFEESQEEDRVLARALLQGRSAEDIAAALARLYRARLPAPEELFEGPAIRREPESREARKGGRKGNDAEPRSAWTREAREAREGAQGAVWFRLNVGREKNADPKWLIPLICRRGHVTKPEIGAIRVFGRETKFEIVPAAAERFAAAVKDNADDGIRIEPAGAPAPSGRAEPRFRPRLDWEPSLDGRAAAAPAEGASKPRAARPGKDRPNKDRPAKGRPAKDRGAR
jgi:ATP-dependent RNA helicase DeaD